MLPTDLAAPATRPVHRSEGSICFVRNGDLAEERKAQLGLKDNKIKETENEVGSEQPQIGLSFWNRRSFFQLLFVASTHLPAPLVPDVSKDVGAAVPLRL